MGIFSQDEHYCPEKHFDPKVHMEWVKFEVGKKQPKTRLPFKKSTYLTSKRLLVRWRFISSDYRTKWKYSFGAFYVWVENSNMIHWQIEGATGNVEVSHYCILKKPGK